MPYSNFQQSATISHRLEINFGSGFENITNFLSDITIIEEAVDKVFAGLVRRDIEVRLLVDVIDLKWARKNLPIRLYITANSFEELVFNGLTLGNRTISGRDVVLDVVESTDSNFNRVFGTDSLDMWFNNLVNFVPGFQYLRDGGFLPAGDNEEGGLIIDTNYRPRPPIDSVAEIDYRVNALVNKNSANAPGYYTIDQMLKAMGCLGGYNKDGIFKLKKRVWNNPTTQYDIRDLIDIDSFTTLDTSELSFNSLNIKGHQARHFRNTRPFLRANLIFQSEEISNRVVKANSTASFFTRIPEVFICEGKNLGTFNLQASLDDNADNSLSTGVFLSDKAYSRSFYFNGGTHATSTGGVDNVWNLSQYTNLTGFSVSFWMRSEFRGERSIIMSNRNSTDDGITIDLINTNGSLRLVNHKFQNILANNNAFLSHGVWQKVDITVNQTTRVVSFYRDGNLVNRAGYGSALGSSLNAMRWGADPQSGGDQFQGNLSDFKIYDYLLTDQDVKAYSKVALPTTGTVSTRFAFFPGGGGPAFRGGLIGYYQLNQTTGVWTDNGVQGVGAITISGTTTWQTNAPDELRVATSNSINFLASYGSNNFDQTINFNVQNTRSTDVFIKRLSFTGRGVYQKIEDINIKKTNFLAGEVETNQELESFYLNDPTYCDTLGTNLLSAYSSNGNYQFSTVYQPRLMVGDIVRFKAFGEPDIKGVILRNIIEISKGVWKNKLIVKKIT